MTGYAQIFAEEAGSRHRCAIYDGAPAKYLPELAKIIREKLRENYRCFYLNCPAMVKAVRTSLTENGINVQRETRSKSLVLASERTHLSNGRFDVDGMLDMLAGTAEQALCDGYDGLFATGDMTWEFGVEKNLAKLLEYERGLEKLFEIQPALSGICQYHVSTLPPDAIQQGLMTHQRVYVNETLSAVNPFYLHRREAAQHRTFITAHDVASMLDRLRRPVDA